MNRATLDRLLNYVGATEHTSPRIHAIGRAERDFRAFVDAFRAGREATYGDGTRATRAYAAAVVDNVPEESAGEVVEAVLLAGHAIKDAITERDGLGKGRVVDGAHIDRCISIALDQALAARWLANRAISHFAGPWPALPKADEPFHPLTYDQVRLLPRGARVLVFTIDGNYRVAVRCKAPYVHMEPAFQWDDAPPEHPLAWFDIQGRALRVLGPTEWPHERGPIKGAENCPPLPLNSVADFPQGRTRGRPDGATERARGGFDSADQEVYACSNLLQMAGRWDHKLPLYGNIERLDNDLSVSRRNARMYEARIEDIGRILGYTGPKHDDLIDALSQAVAARNELNELRKAEAELAAMPRRQDFGYALKLLRAGKAVRRDAWFGSSWVTLSPGAHSLPAKQFWAPANKAFAESNGGTADVLPSLTRKDGESIQMGWTPSQADVLGDDWTEADPSDGLPF